METPAIYPAINGVCPRCGTGEQDRNAFCSECSLRLAAGLWGLEGRAGLASAGWMQANPDRAAAWRTRIGADDASRAATRPAVPSAEDRQHQKEQEIARSELARLALEARVLAQVADDALRRLAAARTRCAELGVSASDISEHVALERVPGLRTPVVPASTPRGGGGFALFYAEAGFDADGDGDVDGGLIDTLTGGDDNGEDGVLGFLGDLFG